MRILIADDNDINRDFLKAALGDPGIQIEEAVNGRQALDHFLQQPFDLVLMDIRMPEMDGIEATRAIRQAESRAGRTHGAKIIGLTADLQLSTTTNLQQQGFDNCLAKPISRDTVRQLLASDVAPEPTMEESSATPVMDREAALAAAGGNVELLDRLMGMLQQELTRFLPEIRQAVASNDFAAARAPVHKLRGSAGYTGCLELKETAAKLELALTRGQPGEITPALDELAKAADNVRQL
ncbi:MAG: response regulator [Pseudomonadota bacterium]